MIFVELRIGQCIFAAAKMGFSTMCIPTAGRLPSQLKANLYKVMKKKFILFFLFIAISACDKKSKVDKAVEEIPVDMQVERFEQVFFEAQPSQLPEIKRKYPQFFPADEEDAAWIEKMTHPQWRELYSEVQSRYKDFSRQEQKAEDMFRYIRYYFPNTPIPKLVTLIGNMDYTTKAVYADSIAVISLELYLGKDHRFYTDPKYLTQNYEESQIMPDLAESFAMTKVRPPDHTFLSQMIYWGKVLYIKDLILPDYSDADKIGYTQDQIKWSAENESYIWRYFIENQLLYDTDAKLAARFINPGPFSKFYLEIDNESPGRIGQWIGWQIVRAYMKKNDIPLQDMLKMDAKTLFEQSKYKPAKNE